jgi:hypothetical protein
MTKKKWIVLAPLILVGTLLFVALGGVVVRELWNWLLPPVFGLREITFWQALGLLVLCRILFGGCGMRGSAHSKVRRRMAERWESMPPEERERLRALMRERWGAGPSVGESSGQ